MDEFNAADAGVVLVSQVQAGGTGLNIQAASVVVFCEHQLTPAIENQAIARAYRMGQTRDVLVYRLLADESMSGCFKFCLPNKRNSMHLLRILLSATCKCNLILPGLQSLCRKSKNDLKLK